MNMKNEIVKHLFALLLILILVNYSSSQTNCESGKFYFPFPNSENAEIGLDTLVNEWYSSHLKSMNEPILTCENDCEVIRIMYLGTWSNPEIYRIEKCRKNVIGYHKQTNGHGGYEPGELIKETKKEINPQSWVNVSTKFTNLKSSRVSNETSFGTDGSQWIIERRTDSTYEYIDRWSIELTNKDKELFEYCKGIMNLIKE